MTVLNWLFFASGHVTHTGLAVRWQVRCRDAGQEHAHLGIWQAENERVYGVLERGLAGRDHLAGDYSIADIAAYPWIYRWQMQEIDLDRFSNVRTWLARVGAPGREARPADPAARRRVLMSPAQCRRCPRGWGRGDFRA